MSNFMAVAGRIDEKSIIVHTSAPESSFDWISYLLSLFYKLKKKEEIQGHHNFLSIKAYKSERERFSNLTLTKVFIGGRMLFTFSLT